MGELRNLFQWKSLITPYIINVFYWLAIGLLTLYGLAGTLRGIATAFFDPLTGAFTIATSLLGTLVGIIFVRIMSEYVLIAFDTNKQLRRISGSQSVDFRNQQAPYPDRQAYPDRASYTERQ